MSLVNICQPIDLSVKLNQSISLSDVAQKISQSTTEIVMYIEIDNGVYDCRVCDESWFTALFKQDGYCNLTVRPIEMHQNIKNTTQNSVFCFYYGNNSLENRRPFQLIEGYNLPIELYQQLVSTYKIQELSNIPIQLPPKLVEKYQITESFYAPYKNTSNMKRAETRLVQINTNSMMIHCYPPLITLTCGHSNDYDDTNDT